MLMALELMICACLISIGACLWYWVERRTERLVNRERRETEHWRRAYVERLIGTALPEFHEPPTSYNAPLPIQLHQDTLLMDENDRINLQTYGRTGKKRIHPQKAGA